MRTIQTGQKALAILALMLSLGAYAVEGMHNILFADVEALFQTAKEARSPQLSPAFYNEALGSYQSARNRMKKGDNLERIKRDIAKAKEYLNKALTASELAAATFGPVEAAKEDAMAAKAQEFAQKEWGVAEEQFSLAVRRLEKGSLKRAQKAAKEAELTYRAAELAAIKRNYLSDTRALIAKADKQKIAKQAPQTLLNSQTLLAKAEKALSENRYDVDEPRSLARQAQYEARRAFRIAEAVKPVSKRKKTPEALMLELESPIERISSSLDLTPQLDGSVDDPAKSILEMIAKLRKDSYDLVERNQEMAILEKQLAELEARLGLQSERLAIQEANRKKMKQIESLFTESEALVMKKGENILLRLVGLNFRSGSASIDRNYYDLLERVQKGLNLFPKAKVIIEGHTDSFGSDASNLNLSDERAASVMTYLLANMRDRKATAFDAVGFGESRPIGNNENPEGREKNRRIDLVIQVGR